MEYSLKIESLTRLQDLASENRGFIQFNLMGGGGQEQKNWMGDGG